MGQVLKLLDYVWSIRFIKGYRSLVARSFLIGVSAYQWIVTAHPGGLTLPFPALPVEWYSGLTAYFGLQLEKFASEHQPS